MKEQENGGPQGGRVPTPGSVKLGKKTGEHGTGKKKALKGSFCGEKQEGNAQKALKHSGSFGGGNLR